MGREAIMVRSDPRYSQMDQPQPRTVTALAVAPGEGFDFLYAACHDGTVWGLTPYKDTEWTQLPSIPQEGR